jgi:hypothetical protein
MISKLFAILTCAILLQTSSVSASAKNIAPTTPDARACGNQEIKFDVQTGKGQSPAQPDAAKARIYFIEDDSAFNSIPKPITRLGVDGEWAGATHGNSYMYVSVDPGVHHLCASWQPSAAILGRATQAAAAHFTAEAGGMYYFQVKNIGSVEHGTLSINLKPMDSDEGKLVTGKLALSTSHPKK